MLEQEERIPAGHSIEVADPPAGYRHLPDLGIIALDCLDVRRLHAFPPPNDMSEPVRALKTPGGDLLDTRGNAQPAQLNNRRSQSTSRTASGASTFRSPAPIAAPIILGSSLVASHE